ncbi:MAG: DUF6036 family nucleotidyltransferase [Verrucomicrobiales bacterium]|nr:DUF6036 family nucleotidyltransferase [Verrucomicrobiales bacterium]
MNNPQKILTTLDGFLQNKMRLILYGRAALVLGYHNTPSEYGATMDVDAILPLMEMPRLEKNDDFWNALEATNAKLEHSGLYLTHLFAEDQVILSKNWLDHLVPIHFPSSHLYLFRPSTTDLILTKMMRVDPHDRDDIAFLLTQNDANLPTLNKMIENAIVPDIPELHEAFRSNTKWLKELLSD